MAGSDFFEQEIRERIQAYIMRPSGELWEKIESSLPLRKRKRIFLKKYILLLSILMLSITLSNNQHTNYSIHLSKQQKANSNKLYVKSIRNSNLSTKIISEQFLSAGIGEDLAGLQLEKNIDLSSFNFVFERGMTIYDQTLMPYTKRQLNLKSVSNIFIQTSIHQDNNNSITSQQIEKEETGLDQSKPKNRKTLLVYFSPAITDRLFNPKNKFSYANYGYSGNSNQVAHKPALGLEAGLAFLKQIKPGIQLRSGIQFNYSCYTITASRGEPELASLYLNSFSASQRISNLDNRDGFNKKKYPNSSFQISLPVGMMIRLNKNPESNINIGISLQPSFTVHGSAYLLSSDYRNYVKAPDLLRRFNIYSGAELIYSKKVGQYHLLAGPQLRYQLLSGHKKEYSFRENLIDFGFKLGIARDLP